MEKQILILHHVEAEWEGAWDEPYLGRVLRYIRRNKDRIERIIHTSHNGEALEDQFNFSARYPERFTKLSRAISETGIPIHTEIWDFAPYEESDLEAPWGEGQPDPDDVIWVSSDHDYTYLYPWMRDLARYSGRLIVTGGAKYECLLDFREALTHLGIEYETEDKLVYG